VYDAGGGTYRIVRNHELGEGNDIGPGRPTGLRSTAWDQKSRGCTTTMTVDNDGNLLESFISLNGTNTNCSGTPTPWNTWLTCEETTVGVKSGLEKPHGYVFEVDPFADEPVVTKPYKAMGRFLHEAAAVDPDTGVVYLTEDNGPDGFYRFVSDEFGNLKKGTLQILKVKGQPGYNTVIGQTVGEILPAVWITIADPDPADAEDDDDAVYRQGRTKGAARFLGGEGCTYRANGPDPGSCVFNSSDGGDAELGQIWQYTPTTDVGDLNEQGELVLLYESTDENAMQGPDNLCTSPSGAIIVAEDGDATNFLRALLPDNSLITIGENLVDVRIAYIDSSGIVFDPDTPFDDFNFTAGNGRSEFAGCRFSPDGKFLFVNVQVPGITLAITGDWESIGL
jgi:secreted PhoX family phosphatase